MKTLGLLRHAKSDWSDADKRDFDRGLNARGRKGAALMGAHVRAHPVKWGLLLASPAERVQRTLEAAALGLSPHFDDRLYLASAAAILDIVREQASEADAVLVAGHNPGLQDVLLELVPPAAENALFDEAVAKFPTAAFAVLDLPIDDWASLGKGPAMLSHFARPRDLDPALGPED